LLKLRATSRLAAQMRWYRQRLRGATGQDVVIDYISVVRGNQTGSEERQKGKMNDDGVHAAGAPCHQLGPIATAVRVSPVAGRVGFPARTCVHLLQASPAPCISAAAIPPRPPRYLKQHNCPKTGHLTPSKGTKLAINSACLSLASVWLSQYAPNAGLFLTFSHTTLRLN
jgi:hypothetical protein